MSAKRVLAVLMSALPLFLFTVAAEADGVDVNLTNDGTEDILVTVYDKTLGPGTVVLSHQRINGFTSFPLSVASDARGRANLAWTAVSVDPNQRRCGHAEKLGLTAAASVAVHVDTDCAAGQSAPAAATD
jgi:hypothetical protein